MSDRIKGMIEQRVSQEGFSIQSWRDTLDGPTAVLGRFVVIEDDDDQGLYLDDEGEVSACVIGAEQYHNERVSFTFTPDDYAEGEGVEAELFQLDRIS